MVAATRFGGMLCMTCPLRAVTARCTSDTEKPERNRPGLRWWDLAVWPRPDCSAAVGQRAPGGWWNLQPVLQLFRQAQPRCKAQQTRSSKPLHAVSTAGGALQGWRGTAGSAAWSSASWGRAPACSFGNGDKRTTENLGRLRRSGADGIDTAPAQGSSVVALPLVVLRRRLTWGDGPRSALRRCITLVDLRPFAAPCVGVPG